jgi:hypothetical protein
MRRDGLAQFMCNNLPLNVCIHKISVWLLDQILPMCPGVSLLSNLSINPVITIWKDGVKQHDMGQYVSERIVILKKIQYKKIIISKEGENIS